MKAKGSRGRYSSREYVDYFVSLPIALSSVFVACFSLCIYFWYIFFHCHLKKFFCIGLCAGGSVCVCERLCMTRRRNYYSEATTTSTHWLGTIITIIDHLRQGRHGNRILTEDVDDTIQVELKALID